MQTASHRRSIPLAALVLALSSACSAPAPNPDVPKPQAKPAVPAATKTGVLAPANATAWSYWPEEWSGGLLVLDAKPQGTAVKSGDEIARFDVRQLDEQIRQAEIELASARVRHGGLVERQKIDEEAARSSVAQAEAALERSKRALDGYLNRELAFSKRSDDIQKRREASYVENQVDELAELQKMYEKDELVSGTEEKVLKRQKRDLAITRDSTALSREQAAYHFEVGEALEREQREEAVRVQTEALDRLRRTQDVERRARADAESRSTVALADQEKRLARLKKDREALVAKSPRDGVLLHGAARDYRPGRTSPRHERGSQLGARTDLFVIADAAPKSIALDLAEADLSTWKDGAKAKVKLAGGRTLLGTLQVEAWPRPDGTYDARVDLDEPAIGLPYGAHAEVEVVP